MSSCFMFPKSGKIRRLILGLDVYQPNFNGWMVNENAVPATRHVHVHVHVQRTQTRRASSEHAPPLSDDDITLGLELLVQNR